jgi:hypothetical protein
MISTPDPLTARSGAWLVAIAAVACLATPASAPAATPSSSGMLTSVAPSAACRLLPSGCTYSRSRGSFDAAAGECVDGTGSCFGLLY